VEGVALTASEIRASSAAHSLVRGTPPDPKRPWRCDGPAPKVPEARRAV